MKLSLTDRVTALLYVEQSGVPIEGWGANEEEAQINVYATILGVPTPDVRVAFTELAQRKMIERRTEVSKA
jgi:hypothetical protein